MYKWSGRNIKGRNNRIKGENHLLYLDNRYSRERERVPLLSDLVCKRAG